MVVRHIRHHAVTAVQFRVWCRISDGSIAPSYCRRRALPIVFHWNYAKESYFSMREPGLSDAIRAAGGVSELARQIGISQPSISNWIRIPAERVLAVEAVTGIDRTTLRPDLYSAKETAAEIDEIDIARSQEYALLAMLLLRAPDAKLLSRLAALRG